MTYSLLRQVHVRRLPLLLALLAIILVSRTAAAQVVTDPRLVEFTPSANHDTVLSDGRPMVDRYLFKVYKAGAAQPFQTTDMGKPSPDTDGTIRYDFSSTVAAWPLPGGDYESRVDAVGPGGDGLSAASNLFTFTTSSCTYALTSSSASFPSTGGGGSVGVSTSSGCPWTAASSASWVTLGSTGGTGSATLLFDVAANAGSSSRTATLTIAGTTYMISQQGAGCGYSLSLSTQSIEAPGGAGSVAVTSSGGCNWTATSNAAWITITAGASGSGAGTVSYNVAANATSIERTGTLTIAGLTYTVIQRGLVSSCSCSLSASSQSFPGTGGAGSVAVSSSNGCSWTATSNASWITITAGASGTTTGSVNYTVAPNPKNQSRTGTITISGLTYTVTEAKRVHR